MPRDYAARNRAPRRKKAGLPGWVWMIVGLSMGLAVAVFVYISRPMQPLPGQELKAAGSDKSAGEKPAAVPSGKSKPAAPSSAKDERVPIPPKEKPRFTFYELLPNQEVVVPAEVAKPAAPAPATPAATTAATASAVTESYIIQVASYRSEGDAENQKAKLALMGIESRIEKVTIDNKDTYFRVRIGPEKDLTRARTVLAQLESNGIQGLLVKVR